MLLNSWLSLIAHNSKSYTHKRTAGNLLSRRKTAQAERYTPKTLLPNLAE